MSRFASEFFAQSPVLILPLIALLIFVGIFLFFTIQVLRMKTTDVERFARLPLEESEEENHGQH